MITLYTFNINKARQLRFFMKDLTSGNINKNLLLYAFPALLSILLNRTYTTIDTIMIGQIIGEYGLAAVGSTGGLITALSSLFWGAGTGISIYFGMLMSKKETDKLISSIKSNVFFTMIVAFIVSFFAIAFYKPIFSVLNVNQIIYKDALLYYVTIIISRILLSANAIINDSFACFGNPSYALKMSAISCIVNISLNFVFLKILPLGVFGVGLATFLAILVNFIINMFSIRKLIRSLSPEKVKLKIVKSDVISAYKIALPCMLQQLSMYFSSVAVQPIVNSFGNASTAAYDIALKIYDFCTICFFATSRGMSVFCTQCCGSGKTHLIKKGMLLTVWNTLMFSAPVIVSILVFPRFVASLFINDVYSATAMLVVRYIVLCFPFIVFAVANNYFHNFFRGVLKPTYALISTATYTVTRIISTYLLYQNFKMDGVYFGFNIAWLTEFIICIVFFISKKWKNKTN